MGMDTSEGPFVCPRAQRRRRRQRTVSRLAPGVAVGLRWPCRGGAAVLLRRALLRGGLLLRLLRGRAGLVVRRLLRVCVLLRGGRRLVLLRLRRVGLASVSPISCRGHDQGQQESEGAIEWHRERRCSHCRHIGAVVLRVVRAPRAPGLP